MPDHSLYKQGLCAYHAPPAWGTRYRTQRLPCTTRLGPAVPDSAYHASPAWEHAVPQRGTARLGSACQPHWSGAIGTRQQGDLSFLGWPSGLRVRYTAHAYCAASWQGWYCARNGPCGPIHNSHRARNGPTACAVLSRRP